VIASDGDRNLMVSVVEKVKNLVVYVDHDDNLVSVDWNDIVANHVNEFPKVLLSPHKVVYIEKNSREKLFMFYTDLKKELRSS
jgi:hypothetical protein